MHAAFMCTKIFAHPLLEKFNLVKERTEIQLIRMQWPGVVHIYAVKTVGHSQLLTATYKLFFKNS